jgi:hypothetical protein
MEEAEQLIKEAEADVTSTSDEAMRLMNRFGSDALLLDFVSTANQCKNKISLIQLRLVQLRNKASSDSRNTDLQILLVEAKALKTETGRFKEIVGEIGRND